MTDEKISEPNKDECNVCGTLAIVTLTGSGLGPTSIVRCETCLKKGAEPFGLAAVFFGNNGMHAADFMKVKETWKDGAYLTIFEAIKKYPEELGELYRDFLEGFPEGSGVKSVNMIVDVMENSDVSEAEEFEELGARCFAGRGCDIDIFEAYYFYRRAAETGSERAQIALASIYGSEDLGEKIFKNHAKEVGWLSKAESQSSAQAMLRLGVVHLKGFHKDEIIAFEYFKNAIRQSEKDSGYYKSTRGHALSLLGKMYRHGLGVQISLERAFCMWLEVINSDDDDIANHMIDDVEDNGLSDNFQKLEQGMTKAEIMSARKMSYKTVLSL